MNTWHRVSREKPCPVCRKPDWCTVADDVVCCMRVESDLRMGNGGWRHRIGGNPYRDAPRSPSSPPPKKVYLSPRAVGSAWARFCSTTSDEAISRLASLLGATSASLVAMGACWAWPHDAWGFPMFDGTEQFVGLRLRSEDGDKWSLRGGQQGIFIPSMDVPEHVVVCEGPTDAAAAVSVGFYAIGRPSCTGGVREIKEFCQRHKVKRLTIVADNDGPGRAGAERFRADVGLVSRLSVLPTKDLREWIGRGAMRETIEWCFNAAKWR